MRLQFDDDEKGIVYDGHVATGAATLDFRLSFLNLLIWLSKHRRFPQIGKWPEYVGLEERWWGVA